MTFLLSLLFVLLTPHNAYAVDISECTTVGGVGESIGSVFGYVGTPDIQCSCPDDLSSDEFAQLYRSNPKTDVQGCIDGCKQAASNNQSLHITGYTVQCTVAATGELAVVSQGLLSGEQLKFTENDCEANTFACSCPDTGTAVRVEQLGLPTNTIEECKIACFQYRDNHPGEVVTKAALTCKVNHSDYLLESVDLTGPIPRSDAEKARDIIFPALGVDIPGFNPKDPSNFYNAGGNLTSNILGAYIGAIYRFLLVAGALIAIVMMMIAGVEWTMAAGNSGTIQQARTRIVNAIFGLVLIFTAYTIAYWIDPATTRFKSLNVTSVPTSIEEQTPDDVEQPEDGSGGANLSAPVQTDLSQFNTEDVLQIQSPATGTTQTVVHINDKNIHLMTGSNVLHPDVAAALYTAAAEMDKTYGTKIKVTSGGRTMRHQAELFYDYCLKNSAKKCSPEACSPVGYNSPILSRDKTTKVWTLKGDLANVTDRETIIATIERNGNVANCPHTSTIAVDAWCDTPAGRNWTYQPLCQLNLTKVMIKNGFCRLSSEAWHFELDSRSNSDACSTSNNTAKYGTNTPDTTCTWWTYSTRGGSIGCKDRLPN